MGEWESINPNQLIPGDIISAITSLADILTAALSLPASLSFPSLPSLPDINPVTLIVNTLLDVVSGLLNAGRLHILQVPISKTIPFRPTPSLPPTLDDLQAALDITLGPSSTAGAAAYENMIQKTGGNAGFYNTFATSLLDPTDPNRPQYEAQHDAVVMVALLAGAPRFDAILSAASTFDILTRPKAGASLAARTVATPQNVVARTVGTSTSPGVGIRVDWDVPASSITALYFPSVTTTVNRYAVIRSSNIKILKATSVLDLFSTQDLTEGLTEGDNTVVAVGSGKNSAVFDTNAPTDPSKPQYYAVAWELKITENAGTSILQFDKLSNIVKATPKSPTPPQTGQGPNWTATAAAIDAFPDVARAARQMIEEARVLLKPSTTAPDKISSAIALASGAAQRIAARASELIGDVKRLSRALSRPMPSLYVTQMSSTSGGNAFLMAELAKRLGDTSDPSRPPFDNGEYVCGVCLVAGAPRLADLAAIASLFDSLFGPPTASNPLLSVLSAIDTAVTQTETTVFGPNMRPLPAGTVLATVPSTPAIANSGVPVSTSDPANPNAGDTNVVPTAELC